MIKLFRIHVRETVHSSRIKKKLNLKKTKDLSPKHEITSKGRTENIEIVGIKDKYKSFVFSESKFFDEFLYEVFQVTRHDTKVRCDLYFKVSYLDT